MDNQFNQHHYHRSRSWFTRKRTGIIIVVLLLLISGGAAGVAYHYYQVQPAPKPAKTIPVKKHTDTVALAKPLHLTQTKAHQAIVIDAQTGQVLGEKNANQQVGIASESKILTAYAVLKAIKAKKITWDTKVPITKKSDWSHKDPNVYAHLDVHEGEKLPVRTLFNAMYTLSANDAAFALADFMKPKDLTQQQALTKWAQELNLNGSKWFNAAGQLNRNAGDYEVKHQKWDAENTASVAQVAKMTYQNLQISPELHQDYHDLEFVYHPTPEQSKSLETELSRFQKGIKSHLNNPLNISFKNYKTGSSPKYGGGISAFMQAPDGHQFIVVVDGAGPYISRAPRFQESVNALNEVLAHKQPISFKKGQEVKNLKTIDEPHAHSTQIEKKSVYWNDK
ncbi:D-alanyl-D-alanine carboxypeptidase family protein [Fructilactobacillus cliffordii]|uniref:Serine hydrolase n=1 Tax=Fructilactobacillus cliffordii TaxID=2940299 RepID=A0A9Q9E1S8_9LACO|nr:serine hydrolase [Fructilactobacillus cliffordii]USS89060.1 serine hydrolase [Fructilactobacillus cliffordii]